MNGQLVSYHEAGHAVVAIALGLTPAAASIRRGEQHLGKVWFGDGCHHVLPDDEHARRHAVTLFAGEEAERRLTDAVARLAEPDRESASVLLGRDEARIHLCRLQAKVMVRTRWMAVEAVAERLLESSILTGGEIERIVRPFLPQR